MGKSKVKSSKLDSKAKKNVKPVKVSASSSVKKVVKQITKKQADKKNDKDKKVEAKSTSLKTTQDQKSSTKADKTKAKESSKSGAKAIASSSAKATLKTSGLLKNSPSKEVKTTAKGIVKTEKIDKKGLKNIEINKAEEKKTSTDKITDKKTTPVKETIEKTPGKSTIQKKKNGEKKEEFAIEDDLVGETEDYSSDELSEYQSELENAEEEFEEKEVIVEELVISPAVVVASNLVNKEKEGEVVLTDAEGRRYCRVKDCDQVETVDAYCRYHYLLLWKRIQIRKKILVDGKLERYVEELTSRYPDKFLEVIRRDLRSEKDFISAIQEMEIDESSSDNDFEEESSNFIDEVRGASTESLVEDDEY